MFFHGELLVSYFKHSKVIFLLAVQTAFHSDYYALRKTILTVGLEFFNTIYHNNWWLLKTVYPWVVSNCNYKKHRFGQTSLTTKSFTVQSIFMVFILSYKGLYCLGPQISEILCLHKGALDTLPCQ